MKPNNEISNSPHDSVDKHDTSIGVGVQCKSGINADTYLLANKSEEDICFRCGHIRREHTWVLPSSQEIHKFKKNCGKCRCEKFVSPKRRTI